MIILNTNDPAFASAHTLPVSSWPAATSIAEGCMVWVDLSSPTPEEFGDVLTHWLPVHDLVLSDCMRGLDTSDDGRPHHPKVEDYSSYLFVVAQAPPTPPTNNGEDVGLEQVSIVVGQNVIITVHGDFIEPMASVARMCSARASVMARGTDYVLHLVLDELVDAFMPTVTTVEEELERMERDVLGRSSTRLLLRLLEIKRHVQELRRSVVYMREMTHRLSRGEFDLVSMEESMYYRNVYDHLVRTADQLDACRESINAMMEAYYSSSNTRLNEVMRILTVISTVFLPMTFISSVYGMNFRIMPEIEWPYGYAMAWLLMLCVGGGMLLFFKRKGWLG